MGSLLPQVFIGLFIGFQTTSPICVCCAAANKCVNMLMRSYAGSCHREYPGKSLSSGGRSGEARNHSHREKPEHFRVLHAFQQTATRPLEERFPPGTVQ